MVRILVPLLLPFLFSLTLPVAAQSRLLLIFAPNRSDVRWQRQEALLSRSKAEFQERDLRRFDLFEAASGRAALLRKRCHVKPGQFCVFLIGKDGHVAFSAASPTALSEITERIDRMPMRRAEMRRQEAGQ